jgi:V/A-type H+-transporting ATPase subunit I
MRQLIAAVLEKDIDAATRALLKIGVIDFIDVREIPAEWPSSLQGTTGNEVLRQVRDLRKRLDAYIGAAGYSPADFLETEELPETELNPSSAERMLDEIGDTIRGIRDRQKQIQEEILRLQELRRQLPAKPGTGLPELKRGDLAYVSIYMGKLPREFAGDFETALRDLPALFSRGDEKSGTPDFVIVLKRDKDRIEKLLSRYAWEELKPENERKFHKEGNTGAAEDFVEKSVPVEKIDQRLEELREHQQELNQELKTSLMKRKEEISSLWTGLRVSELSSLMREYYRRTERTFLFSGWLPADQQDRVERALREATGGRCYLEWHKPLSGDDPEVAKNVPVQMRNPKLLSPFQSLVQNYGIPSYGSIDPTPIVAVFYLAMFGLMFGDAGHGLVVFFIGLIGSLRMKRQGKQSMLFPLITWCGVAAIFTGILFGSYFGLPLLPPLWFDYHGVVAGHGGSGSVRSLSDILLITIYFGIAVISVGLLLNWINRLRRGDFIGVVWGAGGLLVGWLYGGGTWTAFYFVSHDYKELPGRAALFLALGIPALLMGLKPVVEYFHPIRGHEGPPRKINILNMLMEWLVELLEIFSGYLSNTLSFMRVAGLGIAHVSLMMAFFQIAEMAASEGRFTLGSYLILLLGNALVIGLEGLSAGIQSLRLNYYEFFSKYFTGNGKVYAPISLRPDSRNW